MTDATIENTLRLIADMRTLTEPHDELFDLIHKYDEHQDELDIYDLEFVSAASGMSYQHFLDKLRATGHE